MFKKAERQQVKLKIAITGPSGGGKTYSALRLSKGLSGKTALIDTENGSASLYADRFDFDTLVITPPYSVKKYVEAVKAAIAAGYETLIIDSISHAWAGEGGLLSKKEQLDAKPGSNSYTNWAPISKEQEEFKSMILNSQIHMICTMRSKQDYVLTQNDKGKMSPQKVGLAPIQRDGMEYEFTTVFDSDMTHNAEISKDRTGLFDGKRFVITEETGKEFLAWLGSAKAYTPPVVVAQPEIKSPIIQPKINPTPQPELSGTLVSAANYVIPIGKKYKGMKLGDIPVDDLKGFAGFLRKDGAPRGASAEVCSAIDRYVDELSQLGLGSIVDEDVPF